MLTTPRRLAYAITLAPGSQPVPLVTTYRVAVRTTVTRGTRSVSTTDRFVDLPRSGGSASFALITDADMTEVAISVDPLSTIAERNEGNNTVRTTVNNTAPCT